MIFLTNCGKFKRTEWSLKKGKEYAMDMDNFLEMCRSCHKKYDITEETIKKIVDKHSRPIMAFYNNKWIPFKSATEAAKYLNIARQDIWKCLNGIIKVAGGMKWKYQ